METMFIAREGTENNITYVDFSIIFRVINCFTYLKQTFGKEDITFILSSSSRDVEWRKSDLS